MFLINNHYQCSSGLVSSFPWPWRWFLHCRLSITHTGSCLPLKLFQQRRNESPNKEQFRDNACKFRSKLACHLETSQGGKCDENRGGWRKKKLGQGHLSKRQHIKTDMPIERKNLSEVEKGICLFWVNLPASRRRGETGKASLQLWPIDHALWCIPGWNLDDQISQSEGTRAER